MLSIFLLMPQLEHECSQSFPVSHKLSLTFCCGGRVFGDLMNVWKCCIVAPGKEYGSWIQKADSPVYFLPCLHFCKKKNSCLKWKVTEKDGAFPGYSQQVALTHFFGLPWHIYMVCEQSQWKGRTYCIPTHACDLRPLPILVRLLGLFFSYHQICQDIQQIWKLSTTSMCFRLLSMSVSSCLLCCYSNPKGKVYSNNTVCVIHPQMQIYVSHCEEPTYGM